MAVLGFPPSDCNFFCDNIWKAAQEIHLCRFYLLGRSYGDAAWRECPHGADGEDGGHLVRNGSVGPIAIAAFATGFISYWWLTLDMGPAKAGLRAEPRILANSNMTQPKFVNSGTAVSLGQEGHGARLASLGGNEPDLTFEQPDHRSEPPSAGRLTLSVSRYINPCVPRSPSAIVFSVKFRPPAPRPHPSRLHLQQHCAAFRRLRWHLVPLCVHGSRRPRRSHRNQDSSFRVRLRPLLPSPMRPIIRRRIRVLR